MSLKSTSVAAALTLTALATLSGCDKAPGAAQPPAEAAKPVAAAGPASPAAPDAASAEGPQDSEREDGLKSEAKLLNTLGQPGARQGSTLTLQHNGKAALVLTDDEESYNLLTAVIQVPTANGVQTVYEVTTTYVASPDGPSSTFYDVRGVAIESYEGYGQWRGAVFAVADQEQTYGIGDDGRVSGQLFDWSSKPHRKFDFKSRCQPKAWVSDTEIKGVCTRPTQVDGSEDVGEEEIDAVYTRVGPNAWRLRELRAPKDKLKAFDNNPPTAYDETVSGEPYSGNP
ncbi:hypothetical protein [Caulobacter sp. HMWF025]|uniref:hypothetical protein n=1 Tax=Caulobacter sp. HMWF025 TaxID=2056860 RepID=UPI000D3BBACF|nr:hypothetical protein [Caulobacter sp. HMWF025]PTT05449.1 hypothetical protein DBR10_15850 [Caulobacter sp. HMWF025]